MSRLVIHSGGSLGCLGLSLRGDCNTPQDAQQLAQTMQQFFTTSASRIWIDCQQLQAISEVGQQAIIQANSRARALGIACYWCGLPVHLRTQLLGTGALHLLLLPANCFEGPRFLLPELAASRRLPID